MTKKRLQARPTMLDSLSRLSAQSAVGPALQQARHLVLPFAPQPVLLEGFVIHLGRANHIPNDRSGARGGGERIGDRACNRLVPDLGSN